MEIKTEKIGNTGYLVAAKVGTWTAQFDVMHGEENLWTITRVAVPEDYRNQGLGTKLMQELLRWADGEKQTLQAFVLGADQPIPGVDTEGLYRFLGRFGFVPGKIPGQVIRKPKS